MPSRSQSIEFIKSLSNIFDFIKDLVVVAFIIKAEAPNCLCFRPKLFVLCFIDLFSQVLYLFVNNIVNIKLNSQRAILS